MQLPQAVRRSIEERGESIGLGALKQASAALSAAYRQGRPPRLSTPEQLAVYLLTRMPATYAATYSILEEAARRLTVPVETILDAGAGTGSGSLAAAAWFPHATITLLEREALPARAAREFLPAATVLTTDMAAGELPAADLVLASYSIGEVREPVELRLWSAARRALVLVEPGTPAGFARIRAARTRLLAAGAHLLAPCPAESECPVVEPDWCHFAARVERSSLHRRLKDGELGYEDEKFSYLVCTREPGARAAGRVVRRPRHQPGLITLETCRPEGLRTEGVTRRDRDAFRRARHLSWGDPLE